MQETGMLCEVSINKRALHGPALPLSPLSQDACGHSSLDLIQCSTGYLTHSFLACDSVCGEQRFRQSCPVTRVVCGPGAHARPVKNTVKRVVEMFVCATGMNSLHYTLVCDFANDCPDGSDESFCARTPCRKDKYACNDGACVPKSMQCDGYVQCLDGSDEWEYCDTMQPWHIGNFSIATQLPGIVHFDERGSFLAGKLGVSETCPATHYRCVSEPRYCLPVFTRCNGFYDCEGREDEQGCDDVTCPGF
jgi:hypothetical protein